MKKILLHIFALHICMVGIAQNEGFFNSPYVDHYSNVIPQTPNAANFTIYGNTPVDYSTGIPNINIPIYTLEVDGVQVPISISYHASGVKVDDLASVVGLKWTLNAGGGVFRSIAGGRPDEQGWLHPLTSFLESSWYQTHSVGIHSTQENLRSTDLDHDPDNFSYSFLNNSGKFIFKPKTTFSNVSIMKERLDKITLIPEFDIASKTLNAFKAKDYNGNVFDFGTQESNENTSMTTRSNSFSSSNSLAFQPTGWMLDKITTKNNKLINFSYDSYQFTYQINVISQRLITHPSYDPNAGTGTAPVPCWGIPDTESNIVKESSSVIYRPENQLVTFIDSENTIIEFVFLNDPSLSDWKKKLDKIIIKDKIKNKQKEFRFVYGKFSGDPRLQLKEVYEVGFEGQRKPSYIFTYNETNSLPAKGSFAKDHWGYYNGQNNNSILVPDTYIGNLAIGNIYQLANRDVNTFYAESGILTKIQYPTGGTTEFTYESNTTVTEKQGGLRVKEIKDLDESGKTYNHTFYTYEGYQGLIWYEYLTHRPLGATEVFSSDYVLTDVGMIKQGYYYDKVTVKQKKSDNQFISSEYHFLDNSTLQNFSSLPKETLLFKGTDTIQKKEFTYYQQQEELINWNQLGDLDLCYTIFGNVAPSTLKAVGYNEPINSYYKTYKHLLTYEYTTDYNEAVSGLFATSEPSTTIKEYEYNDDLLVTSEITDGRYKRKISNHSQMIAPENFDADGEHFWVDLKYPIDYPNETSLENLVINKNLIALPISKIVTNKGQQIQGQFFTYDTSGNIKESYRYNKGQGSNNSAVNYIPNDYDLFATYINSSGKPTQVQRKDGTVISYIWDASENYVLAKIENATHAEATTLVTQSLDLKTISETALTTQLDNIRNGLPAAQVTTFTYDPLKGVASITDPRDETIYYEYDGFGRLEFIKDAQGKILSKNEYNYKN